MICTTKGCGLREERIVEVEAYNWKCPGCRNFTWGSAEELLLRGEATIDG